MKATMRIAVLAAIGLMTAVGAGAEGMPEGMDPAAAIQMEKMQAAMSPGAAHVVLKQFEGEWSYTAKFWMSPDEPAQETTGTSSSKMIYGGRFLNEKVSGTWNGQPFKGQSFTGYDNVRQEYTGIWIDSMMTGIMVSSGQYDAATNTLRMSGTASCPMTGEKNRSSRMETTWVDEDHYTMSSYSTDPKGNEFKAMEIEYTRQ